DTVIPRDDCDFFKSTYLDNPFLNKEVIEEIERLKDTDENYWRIYGLGERGISKETIFQTHVYDELPENANHIAYGLDFGFAADPAALVKVSQRGDELYMEELIYSGGLTNQDLGEKFKTWDIGRHDEIIADSAEPKSITELSRMNFNVKPARKGADSIRNGIDIMRRHKLFIKSDSLNLQKEFRNYKWNTDRDGRILPHPKDAWNHGIDAVRYCCLNKLAHRNRSYYVR
ncbi:PBSX family phage terminase large subunit, partial [Neptuniibacter sp.]|uniref:PBSX family phage terminase large subunit n=1 Tax=Neptuniibacter sp. TaxID=1962643 RepID=UPI002619FF93